MVYISFTQIIWYKRGKICFYWVILSSSGLYKKCLAHICKWYSKDWIKMFDNCWLFFFNFFFHFDVFCFNFRWFLWLKVCWRHLKRTWIRLQIVRKQVMSPCESLCMCVWVCIIKWLSFKYMLNNIWLRKKMADVGLILAWIGINSYASPKSTHYKLWWKGYKGKVIISNTECCKNMFKKINNNSQSFDDMIKKNHKKTLFTENIYISSILLCKLFIKT